MHRNWCFTWGAIYSRFSGPQVIVQGKRSFGVCNDLFWLSQNWSAEQAPTRSKYSKGILDDPSGPAEPVVEYCMFFCVIKMSCTLFPTC